MTSPRHYDYSKSLPLLAVDLGFLNPDLGLIVTNFDDLKIAMRLDYLYSAPP